MGLFLYTKGPTRFLNSFYVIGYMYILKELAIRYAQPKNILYGSTRDGYWLILSRGGIALLPIAIASYFFLQTMLSFGIPFVIKHKL